MESHQHEAHEENLWGGPVSAPETETDAEGPETPPSSPDPRPASPDPHPGAPDARASAPDSQPAKPDPAPAPAEPTDEPPSAAPGTPDLTPVALEAWRELIHAHALVIRELERRLREAGLPPLHWYDALQALHEAPERRLRHHELADAILLSRSGLSRLLDRLEGEGLIERQSCAEDRRGAHVVLTAAGDGVLRRMWTVHSAVLAVNFAAPVGAYAAGVKDALRAVSDRLRTGADDGATRERRRAPDRR